MEVKISTNFSHHGGPWGYEIRIVFRRHRAVDRVVVGDRVCGQWLSFRLFEPVQHRRPRHLPYGLRHRWWTRASPHGNTGIAGATVRNTVCHNNTKTLRSIHYTASLVLPYTSIAWVDLAIFFLVRNPHVILSGAPMRFFLPAEI